MDLSVSSDNPTSIFSDIQREATKKCKETTRTFQGTWEGKKKKKKKKVRPVNCVVAAEVQSNIFLMYSLMVSRCIRFY